MALAVNDPCEVFGNGAWTRGTVRDVRVNEEPPIFYAVQFDGQNNSTWYGEGQVRAVAALPAPPSP